MSGTLATPADVRGETTVALDKRIRATRWTARNPVTKNVRLLENGQIEKTVSTAQLVEGYVTPLEFTPDEFVQILQSVGPHDCLSYGIPCDPFASNVLSKRRYESQGGPSETITRTADMMMWPNGPAILMIDYDPSPAGSLSKDELLDAMYKICPHIQDTAHIWMPSTSSCLVNVETNQQVRGIHGQRIYVVVAEGTDIPRAGKALHERAWLHGFGHIKISTAGSMLPRSIVDSAVFQPNRIDYCAGPVCAPPLARAVVRIELLGNPDFALNSRVAIPDLSTDERKQFDGLISRARAEKRHEAEPARQHYELARISQLVKRGVDADVAAKTVARALDAGVLMADFELTTEDGRQVTVGDLMADRTTWHLCRFHDPIEPEYHGDKRIARAHLIGSGRPSLYSFAHGGQRYELCHAAETIQLVAGDRTHYAEQCARTLASRGECYSRGASLVEIGPDGCLTAVGTYQMLAMLDRNFRFEKPGTGRRAGTIVTADAPKELAILLLEAFTDHFLPVKAVLTAPCMDPATHRIIQAPGYDAESQTFLVVSESIQVNEAPTLDQVRIALARLWFPVHRFSFEDAIDQGNMLCASLTAVLRPLLPTAPAFAFDAPVQGSGKTLLVKVLAKLATGRNPAMSPPSDSRSDDELRKKLFSMLLGGQGAIVIDNIEGEINSPSLATLLTSVDFSDRILKESRSETVPSNTLVLMTGNNLTLKGDLPRRVLKCRIDPKIDSPYQREFDFDPLEVVQASRQQLAVDALTLIKGYLSHHHGNRLGKGRMASFETWDDLIRQTVCWLLDCQRKGLWQPGVQTDGTWLPDLADPMDAVHVAVQDDPINTQCARLLHAWQREIGVGSARATTLTIKELIAKAIMKPRQGLPLIADGGDDPTSLHDIFIEIAGFGPSGDIKSKVLGKSLMSMRGRVVNGLRLQVGAPRQNSATYWVERVSGVPGESGEFCESFSINPTTKKPSSSLQRPKEKRLTKPTSPRGSRVRKPACA